MAGVGFAPVAPGTFGSAVGVALFLVTHAFGLPVHIGLVLAVSVLGVWSAAASEAAFGCSDDGRIVIDEVAGQLVALTPLLALGPLGLATPGDLSFLGLAVTGFVAFRAFDIAKPGPVGWAEQRFKGGVGVMADDLVAGLLAAIVLGFGMRWLFAAKWIALGAGMGSGA